MNSPYPPNLAPSTLVDQLISQHAAAVDRLRAALARFITTGEAPDPAARAHGEWSYPELRIDFAGSTRALRPIRAFARLNRAGRYTTTITRPAMFRAFLEDSWAC